MSAALPDVSVTDNAPSLSPLTWVGMRGIDLPIAIAESSYQRDSHARIDAHVDLPTPHVKGIHMSRLYRLLDILEPSNPLTPRSLHRVLRKMIESHRDCGSQQSRLRLSFDMLVRRPALVTEELSGWKSYPVELSATLVDKRYQCSAQVKVGYSSTCPCSAALSRQLIEQGFRNAFSEKPELRMQEVAAWLLAHATLATPHSQRSEARVAVNVAEDAASFGLFALIDTIELALGTPVQTAVKRADEQAFAAKNGQNLMFVEDAARRIKASLSEYEGPRVHVRHLESLHPHDAEAWSGSLEASNLEEDMHGH